MSWQNLTQEQLEALPTHRLLEVFKRYRTWTMSVRGPVCGCGDGYNCFAGDEWSKEDIATRAMRQVNYDFIKKVLDGRGHVDTPEVKVTPNTKDRKLRRRREFAWDFYAQPTEVRTGPITNPEEAVGLQVFKVSKKPFKSKAVYNTVKGVTINPHTNRIAFTFVEDDSIVDAHICNLRKK